MWSVVLESRVQLFSGLQIRDLGINKKKFNLRTHYYERN